MLYWGVSGSVKTGADMKLKADEERLKSHKGGERGVDVTKGHTG